MSSRRESVTGRPAPLGRVAGLAHTVGPAVFVVVICLAVGGLVVQGKLVTEVTLAVVAGFALMMLGGRLKFLSVPIWVAFSGLAYDFVRYPTVHAVVTFDRLWIVAMVGWLFTERRKLPVSRASRYVVASGMCLVAAYGLRSGFTSVGRRTIIQTWFDAGVLPLILFMCASRGMLDDRRLDRLGLAFTVAGGVAGLFGIAERFGINFVTRLGATQIVGTDVGLRVSAPYTTDDVLAVVLLVCLSMTIYWIRRDKVSRLGLGGVVIAIELAGIYLTFFRGAFIGVLVIAAVTLGMRPKRFARMLSAVALVGLLALVGYSELTGGNSGLSQRLDNQQNVSGRLATYQDGIQIFKTRPFYGVGIDEFGRAQADISGTAVNGVEGVTTAHSSYVESLSETGLMGFLPLVAFTLAIGYVIACLLRRSRTPHDTMLVVALASALLAFFVMSIEETTILIPTDNLFLAVIVGIAVGRLDYIEHLAAAEESEDSAEAEPEPQPAPRRNVPPPPGSNGRALPRAGRRPQPAGHVYGTRGSAR